MNNEMTSSEKVGEAGTQSISVLRCQAAAAMLDLMASLLDEGYETVFAGHLAGVFRSSESSGEYLINYGHLDAFGIAPEHWWTVDEVACVFLQKGLGQDNLENFPMTGDEVREVAAVVRNIEDDRWMEEGAEVEFGESSGSYAGSL